MTSDHQCLATSQILSPRRLRPNAMIPAGTPSRMTFATVPLRERAHQRAPRSVETALLRAEAQPLDQLALRFVVGNCLRVEIRAVEILDRLAGVLHHLRDGILL